MEKILNDLSPAIQKLSEIFCVSVEYMQEHFMEYVLMYGRYDFWSNIGSMLFVVLLGSIVGGLAGMLICIALCEFNEDKISQHYKKFVLPCTVIAAVITVISWIAPYIASPEIYSIKAVLELIK